MSTENNTTIDKYLRDYAKIHTSGDIEAAKQHTVVKDVMAMYSQRKQSRSDNVPKKPVRMDAKCDS